MAYSINHTEFRQELASCLSSYFNLNVKDTSKLLSDLLLCLEAEALILERYSLAPNDQNYIFAIDSISHVAVRLKSDMLLDQAETLRTTTESSQISRDEAVSNFLALVQALRSINLQ